MPSPKPDPEVAEKNAELTAAHADAAAEEAAKAERDLAEATKEDPKAQLCPNDNTEMVKHPTDHPHHPGWWHCDTCGFCGSMRGKG